MELSDQTTPKKCPEETASDSPSIPPAPNPSPALEGLMEGLSTDQRTTSASSGHDTPSSTPSQKPKEPNVDLNDNASHIKVRAGSMELLRISEECLTKPPKSPTTVERFGVYDVGGIGTVGSRFGPQCTEPGRSRSEVERETTGRGHASS